VVNPRIKLLRKVTLTPLFWGLALRGSRQLNNYKVILQLRKFSPHRSSNQSPALPFLTPSPNAQTTSILQPRARLLGLRRCLGRGLPLRWRAMESNLGLIRVWLQPRATTNLMRLLPTLTRLKTISPTWQISQSNLDRSQSEATLT